MKLFIYFLLLCFFLHQISSFELNVLHTNDVHSHFMQFNQYGGRCPVEEANAGRCYGGFARQVTKAREIKNTYPNVLYLNAGDFYQGTSWYTLFKWKVMAVFVPLLGLDVMTLGNHEFDDGPEGLLPFLETANMKVVCCNVDFKDVPDLKPFATPSIIMEVGGEKIGIIGYITPDTEFLSRPGKVLFTDEIECVQKEAKAMTENNINKIIALGHSGFTKDVEIAEKVQEVDIVVGGHTNTFLYTGNPPSVEKPQDVYPYVVKHTDGSKALVVQDYTYGKYLGHLTAKFDSDGKIASWTGNPIILDNNTKEDQSILDKLEPYRDELLIKGHEVIGYTSVLLRGEMELCRMKECNMGNFLSDACVSYFSKGSVENGWTKVAVAVWNAGGIRGSIDERILNGNVTRDDIMTVAPFRNYIDIVDLKGVHLKQMLEQSVGMYDKSGQNPAGAFLQVSGLRVTFDLDQPIGMRVVDVKVRCANCRVPKFLPLNDTEVYSVAMNAYIIDGGDGYTVMKKNALHRLETGILDTDIIEQYLSKTDPVETGLEDRITFLSSNKKPLGHGSSSSINISYLSICTIVVFYLFSNKWIN